MIFYLSLGGLAVVLLAAVVARAIRAHRRIELVSRVVIPAAPAVVFTWVSSLARFPKWSPFLVEDPEQKYELKGRDGEVGSQFHWNGRGGKDLGYQEVVSLAPPHRLAITCEIAKPFVARPRFEYAFKPEGRGTEVVQTFTLESGAVDAFFLWAFGVRKKMAATNQLGLQRLSAAIKAEAGAEK